MQNMYIIFIRGTLWICGLASSFDADFFLFHAEFKLNLLLLIRVSVNMYVFGLLAQINTSRENLKSPH